MASITLRFDIPKVMEEFLPSVEWALVAGLLTQSEASDLVVDQILDTLTVEENG